MPSNRYTRIDTLLRVRRFGKILVLDLGGETMNFDAATPETDWLDLVAAWPAVVAAAKPEGSEYDLHRVTIHVEEQSLAALDWEPLFVDRAAPTWSQRCVVRVSSVPARVMQFPFAVPARVLEIGSPRVVKEAVDAALGGSYDTSALIVGSTQPLLARKFVQRSSWATADILHLHDITEDADLVLRTSAPDIPGTLGWILRACMQWQTRLAIIEVPPARLALVRRLGHEIIERGGPAVIVGPNDGVDRVTLYASILHDRPFDWVKQFQPAAVLFAGGGREEALRFSPAGERLSEPVTKDAIVAAVAEASEGFQTIASANTPPPREVVLDSIFHAAGELRLTSADNGLSIGWSPAARIRFADTVAGRMLQKGFVVRPLDDDVSALPLSQYVPIDALAAMVTTKSLPLDYVRDLRTTPSMDDIVREGLDNLSTSVARLEFESHESDGTLPLAVKTVNLRNLVRVARPHLAPVTTPAATQSRHVNANFLRPDLLLGKDGRVAQDGARLSPGEEVHLGIRIGTKDEQTITIGDLVLFEEAFPWSSGADGCWLEIGVTPMDFDNLGAPVQEVWLPREGQMQLVTFALSPRAKTLMPGVASVRFTFYYQNNVVQSFRVAALLTTATGDTASDLARALDIDPKEVPAGAGYLARLEYSAADPTQAETLARRSLSIVANESAGQKVFSIKGNDFFSSTVNSDIANMVQAARDALRDASVNDDLKEYRYDPIDNSGESAELIDRTMQVARRGWELYTQILPEEWAHKAVADLLGDEGVITAAHIDLDHVVPWSLIYDQPVDDAHSEEDVEENGVWKTYDVARAVCPSGLPAADASLPSGACGTRADCLLYGADANKRKIVGNVMYCRDRVICPRHFWGFAHQIEVPAQQKQPKQELKQPARLIGKEITAGILGAVAVGYNPNVRLAKEHVQKLKTQLQARAPIQEPRAQRRNLIKAFLASVQPDVVYLYCHAYTDTAAAPGKPDPNLDFGKRAASDIMSPADFNGTPWTHGPLVFLNGCGTVGFNPAAPSRFIAQFIQSRHASAVIGTEVTVWEELASEMGALFLEEFLGVGKGEKGQPLEPKSAGLALVRARRRLLRKNNPLGLVYTLYGSADLHIVFQARVP